MASALNLHDFLLIFFPISEDFLLDDYRNYRFLTSGRLPVQGVDDAAEFRLTIEAMTIMGICPEDQAGT